MQPDVQQSKLWVTLVSIVLGGIVLVFVIDRASHERSTLQQQDESSQYASTFHINARGLAQPTPTNYVYRVVGPRGSTATITYSNQNGTHVTVAHARLPWSIAIARPVGTHLPPGFGQAPSVVVHANTHNSNSAVTCQAFAFDKLNDQETNSGQYVTVSCGISL